MSAIATATPIGGSEQDARGNARHSKLARPDQPVVGILGAARIAPELLIGKLFPALGCGAVIFPTYGGRFGYSPTTCRELAANARPALAVPAGGITLNRVTELLDFYGSDTMLLIGGNLLLAGDRIAEESAAFAKAVALHGKS